MQQSHQRGEAHHGPNEAHATPTASTIMYSQTLEEENRALRAQMSSLASSRVTSQPITPVMSAANLNLMPPPSAAFHSTLPAHPDSSVLQSLRTARRRVEAAENGTSYFDVSREVNLLERESKCAALERKCDEYEKRMAELQNELKCVKEVSDDTEHLARLVSIVEDCAKNIEFTAVMFLSRDNPNGSSPKVDGSVATANTNDSFAPMSVSPPKIVLGNLAERAKIAGTSLCEKADIMKEIAMAKSTTWDVMKRRLRQEVTDLNSELKDLAQERDRFAEQLKQANDLSDDLRTKVESLQMEMSASRLDPEAKGRELVAKQLNELKILQAKVVKEGTAPTGAKSRAGVVSDLEKRLRAVMQARDSHNQQFGANSKPADLHAFARPARSASAGKTNNNKTEPVHRASSAPRKTKERPRKPAPPPTPPPPRHPAGIFENEKISGSGSVVTKSRPPLLSPVPEEHHSDEVQKVKSTFGEHSQYEKLLQKYQVRETYAYPESGRLPAAAPSA